MGCSSNREETAAGLKHRLGVWRDEGGIRGINQGDKSGGGNGVGPRRRGAELARDSQILGDSFFKSVFGIYVEGFVLK